MKKTALVTGASRGIGRAISLKLLANGYHLIGVSRHIDQHDEGLCEAAEKARVTFTALCADVAQRTDHDKIFDTVNDTFGCLNVFVQNSGVAPLVRTDILAMTEESYDRVMAINLKGPVFLTQKLFPLFGAADLARLIYITSISAHMASINRGEYCLSKAGLSMFAQLMATRTSGTGVKVFEIKPGIIETDMTKPVMEKYQAMIADGLIPEGRMGQSEDIAKVVISLVKGDFDYAHGSVLEISGGMQIQT